MMLIVVPSGHVVLLAPVSPGELEQVKDALRVRRKNNAQANELTHSPSRAGVGSV